MLTPLNFDMPAGACDCHTHIHADERQFPYYAGRVYTPQPASPQQMAALHAALGVQRVVIVTPSVYGADNAATLYGIAARGADARGVAVIDETTTEDALDAMGRQGMRGIRLNLATAGTRDPAVARQRLQRALERMRPRNWHVQMFTSLAIVAALRDLIEASPLPLVFDHFGGARPAAGPEQPGFADLVALVRSGRAYVKISIAGGPRDDYAGFAPLARALIEANPQRILWGTNWPHPNSDSGRKPTEVTPHFEVDNARVLNLLPLWAPDAATRKAILVDNPARLYGF